MLDIMMGTHEKVNKVAILSFVRNDNHLVHLDKRSEELGIIHLPFHLHKTKKIIQNENGFS